LFISNFGNAGLHQLHVVDTSLGNHHLRHFCFVKFLGDSPNSFNAHHIWAISDIEELGNAFFFGSILNYLRFMDFAVITKDNNIIIGVRSFDLSNGGDDMLSSESTFSKYHQDLTGNGVNES
jgi:hypothetical protein